MHEAGSVQRTMVLQGTPHPEFERQILPTVTLGRAESTPAQGMDLDDAAIARWLSLSASPGSRRFQAAKGSWRQRKGMPFVTGSPRRSVEFSHHGKVGGLHGSGCHPITGYGLRTALRQEGRQEHQEESKGQCSALKVKGALLWPKWSGGVYGAGSGPAQSHSHYWSAYPGPWRSD